MTAWAEQLRRRYISTGAEPGGLRVVVLLLSFGPPLVGIYVAARWALAPSRSSDDTSD